MNCIIVDDEPLGRKAIQLLIQDTPVLSLYGSFGDAVSAGKFMQASPVDLVFLDIKMPGVNGLEFARMIPSDTLVIFVTAYAEYALDSYEVDAIDYLGEADRNRTLQTGGTESTYLSFPAENRQQQESGGVCFRQSYLCESGTALFQDTAGKYPFHRGTEGLCRDTDSRTADCDEDESEVDP